MKWRPAALTLTAYVAAAAILTWPLAISLTSRLGALQGAGDPYLNLWILGWGLHAWTTDPASVLSGRVFDANIFFPAEGTLAYSDHFLLQALALSPVYAISGNAVLCYNLLVLVSIAASGLAMHALVRAVIGSTPAAFIAGLAWACWPYRTAHLLHIQLQALYFMPLALLFLHRVVVGRRWRDAMALAVTVSLQAISSIYYGVMTAVMLAVASIVLAVATGQWRARHLWVRLAGSAAIGIVLTGPSLLPYVRVQQSEGLAGRCSRSPITQHRGRAIRKCRRTTCSMDEAGCSRRACQVPASAIDATWSIKCSRDSCSSGWRPPGHCSIIGVTPGPWS